MLKKLVLFNKKKHPVIKAYSFYRKDLWGYLRYLRKYKYKRVMYNLLKRKKNFYQMFFSSNLINSVTDKLEFNFFFKYSKSFIRWLCFFRNSLLC